MNCIETHAFFSLPKTFLHASTILPRRNRHHLRSEHPFKPTSHLSPYFRSLFERLVRHTQVLATNVVSLHLHLAGQDKCPDDAPMYLSRLQLDLVEQTTTLRHHIGLLRGIPAPIQEWICYSELWRLPETAEAPAALTLLRDATDSLMELYESMLPWAAKQCDHAVSYYLLAGHLATLNNHWQALRIFIPPLEVSPA